NTPPQLGTSHAPSLPPPSHASYSVASVNGWNPDHRPRARCSLAQRRTPSNSTHATRDPGLATRSGGFLRDSRTIESRLELALLAARYTTVAPCARPSRLPRP